MMTSPIARKRERPRVSERVNEKEKTRNDDGNVFVEILALRKTVVAMIVVTKEATHSLAHQKLPQNGAVHDLQCDLLMEVDSLGRALRSLRGVLRGDWGRI
jgi:hypothetical protein